ncbi:heterokaryon incompatibility, partial [Leptodontidium sp. MPI-SDFR-AT-0119]
YTALSYVWGDASDRRHISIDGKSLSITASLHCALRHIRDPNHPSTIWADGVCINQASSLDRNSQVSMMGSIYKTAHRTLIFLGTSTPASDEVMAKIRIKTPGIARPEFYEMVETHILSQPWFTRVWTLQELVLSKNPLL